MGCCCMDKNGKKMTFASKFHQKYQEITQIDAKKCGESEKNGFEQLWKLQVVQKWRFLAKITTFSRFSVNLT